MILCTKCNTKSHSNHPIGPAPLCAQCYLDESLAAGERLLVQADARAKKAQAEAEAKAKKAAANDKA